MVQGNEKISPALGLEESILLKWPYYPKQSTDLMWFLSNSPWYFIGLDQIVPNLYETTKDQNCQSNLEERDESWRYNPSRLQTIIQSYSNQNSMVLPQE